MICSYKRQLTHRFGTISGSRQRTCRGAQIAEFAPALFVMLIMFFFPVLDLVAICFAYGVVKLLNDNQVHEASLVPSEQAQDPAGLVKKGIPDQWHQSGLGKFVNVAGRPKTVVSYRAGMGGPTSAKFVVVSTSIVCNPFVFVPFPIIKIPALNAPVPLSATSERQMEDPDNAG